MCIRDSFKHQKMTRSSATSPCANNILGPKRSSRYSILQNAQKEDCCLATRCAPSFRDYVKVVYASSWDWCMDLVVLFHLRSIIAHRWMYIENHSAEILSAFMWKEKLSSSTCHGTIFFPPCVAGFLQIFTATFLSDKYFLFKRHLTSLTVKKSKNASKEA